jgi:hypothetical protein
MTSILSCSSAQEIRGPEMVVYKTPWCGCCVKWADHLRENGFVVVTKEVTDLTKVEAKPNVEWRISSCHTAIVDGYVIEGHVPADVIKRFLEERPPVVGLTVPGMPLGSPGMEAEVKQPYEVLTFDSKGRTEVYAKR